MPTFDQLVQLTATLAWPVVVGLLAAGLGRLVYMVTKRYASIHIGQIGEIEFIKSDLANIHRRFAEEKQKVADAIESKRQKYLNIPNISFHYADKAQITNFYNDYFREPTIESLVSEMTSEVSSDVKGSLPKVLESKIGGKDLSKWISTVKLPETSLNGMFLRYQRETIRKSQVTIGLELVDVELSELQEFQKLVSDLKERFGLGVEQQMLNPREAALKEKAAERTLVKLEATTGAIVIEGQLSRFPRLMMTFTNVPTSTPLANIF